MRLPIILSLLLIGAAGPALAKECRTPHLPPGMEVRLPPGCEEPVPARPAKGERRDSLRAEQGFIDLGNGTQVRISGRVRAEYGVRR
ncbi:hypothetical protein VB618_08925 [Microvirga sp. CF3062]|uniref:hypothetical protein n=1 Tax=Microvirga sp. CF3062 TaxID=3110182 RepID=UPI002E78F22C|nr:hypothetical protein [Microvirga sp. CF3062]MEE1656317.1 hypothetical protein [Microvirga sp. CF3062]